MLVEFQNVTDGPNAGTIQYVHALMAMGAGLEMESLHLFRKAGFGDTLQPDALIAMKPKHGQMRVSLSFKAHALSGDPGLWRRWTALFSFWGRAFSFVSVSPFKRSPWQ